MANLEWFQGKRYAHTLISGWVYIVADGSIFGRSASGDSPSDFEWVEISAPEGPDFLDRINSELECSFSMDDFDGR